MIGSYKLIARISSGAMTNVWLAEIDEAESAKLLVLKTIQPRCAEDELLVKTFLAEASIASQLVHPNVIQVVDFGELDGRYFLATELIAGRTLRQIDRRAKRANQLIDLRFLLQVAIEVCAALSYVHAFDGGSGDGVSLVRLELRPENIMVAFSGLVKLLDLGIMAANAPARGPQTAKGRYLAPERVESSDFSPTSDIFALGVMLYEYATGMLPFSGAEAPSGSHRNASAPPLPPGVHNPAIDPLLSSIILRSIAADPADRYQTAEALAGALTDYLARVAPESLNQPLEGYVSMLFPGEAIPPAKALAPSSSSSVQKEPSPPPFRSQVEPAKVQIAPTIPAISGWQVQPTPWTNSVSHSPVYAPPARPSGTTRPGRSGLPSTAPPQELGGSGEPAPSSSSPQTGGSGRARRVTLSMTAGANGESSSFAQVGANGVSPQTTLPPQPGGSGRPRRVTLSMTAGANGDSASSPQPRGSGEPRQVTRSPTPGANGQTERVTTTAAAEAQQVAFLPRPSGGTRRSSLTPAPAASPETQRVTARSPLSGGNGEARPAVAPPPVSGGNGEAQRVTGRSPLPGGNGEAQRVTAPSPLPGGNGEVQRVTPPSSRSGGNGEARRAVAPPPGSGANGEAPRVIVPPPLPSGGGEEARRVTLLLAPGAIEEAQRASSQPSSGGNGEARRGALSPTPGASAPPPPRTNRERSPTPPPRTNTGPANDWVELIAALGDEEAPPPSVPLRGSKGTKDAPSDDPPPLGVYSGVFRNPASNPFASARPPASAFPTRPSAPPRDFTPSASRDIFGTWRASRPPQAFSMTPSSPRDGGGASPPLGSVFSTRKQVPSTPVPAGPMLSPEAQRALAAFDRGLDLVHRKDHQRALEAWKEAVSLDPSNRTYQANLKRLERLIASATA